MPVRREDVIWSYRLFLNREPESEQVIEEMLRSVTSVPDMRARFLASPEFLSRSGLLFRPTGGNVVIKEIDGLRLFVDLCDFHIGLNIVNDVYERDELGFVRRTVKQGQTVLDIGANIGFFTIVLGGQVGPTGHVYAFEPFTGTHRLLMRSVKENNFEDRITVERAAVGSTAGQMQLISPQTTDNWGGPYLRTSDAAVPPKHEAHFVPIVQLDTYPLRRPIAFIKLDAEGAEPMVLRGATSLLIRDRPTVLAELNPKQLRNVSDCSATDLIHEMDSLDYACHRLEPGGSEVMIRQYDADLVTNVIFFPNKSK
jgi:FkbM family methyltransferase